MWRAERIDDPMAIFLMRGQGTDTDDCMIDVLRKLVAHGEPNIVIALARMTIGGGKALQVRNRLYIPDDDAGAHVAYSIGCPSMSLWPYG